MGNHFKETKKTNQKDIVYKNYNLNVNEENDQLIKEMKEDPEFNNTD